MKKLIIMVASAAMLFSCASKQAEQDVILFDAEDFQTVLDGKETSLYTLKAGDLVMQVTNFGGRVVSLWVPDKDGKYEGGNISLGCRTRFKALNRYSKSLPLLDAPDTITEKGLDLSSSISSGVISGIIFEIQGYISLYPEKISVFTGGDAIYFAKRMKNSIFVVCNLVLMGLALIAVEYDKKD